MGKLNPAQVRNLNAPGRYIDGDGLMLEVKPGGSKSWVVRLQAGGKARPRFGRRQDRGQRHPRPSVGHQFARRPARSLRCQIVSCGHTLCLGV